MYYICFFVITIFSIFKKNFLNNIIFREKLTSLSCITVSVSFEYDAIFHNLQVKSMLPEASNLLLGDILKHKIEPYLFKNKNCKSITKK